MQYPDYSRLTLEQQRMIHDPMNMVMGNTTNGRRFRNGNPALAILGNLRGCIATVVNEGVPVYHAELYANDPDYRATTDEQAKTWETPEGKEFLDRADKWARASERASRRKTFNPANADKPMSPRQYRTLVRFADKRYRLNIHDCDKVMNRGEAHAALNILLDKTGTLKRGTKKDVVSEIYAKVDSWRRESERAKQAAEELEDIARIEGNAYMQMFDDFSREQARLAHEVNAAFWEIWEKPDTLVEYDEPDDIEDADEPGDNETLREWTARIAEDIGDDRFSRTQTYQTQEEANP